MSAPASDRFRLLWEDAAKRYEDICGQKLEDLDLNSLQSVEELEKTMEDFEKKFKKFRRRKGKLFRYLRNAMLPVDALSDIGAQGGSMAFPPSAMVFGAVSYMIRAAKDLSEAYDAIEEIFDEWHSVNRQLDVYLPEVASPGLEEELRQYLKALLEVFAYATKTFARGRTGGFLRNIVRGPDTDINNALNKLDRHSAKVHQLAIASMLTQQKRDGRMIQEEFFNLGRKIDESILDTQKTGSRPTEAEEQEEIKKILCPSDSSEAVLYRTMRRRLQGSGDWIYDEDDFESWLTRRIPLLWITGNQGVGKSFLCSNIVTILQDRFPQGASNSSQVSIAYFFFQANERETLCQALRTVAYQISGSDPIYRKYLRDCVRSEADVSNIEKAWLKLFLKFFIEGNDCDSTTYIVLDGLDEADDTDRKELLELVQDLTRQRDRRCRMQLILSGQPQAITDILRMDVPEIKVDQSKTTDDIDAYVETAIQKAGPLRKSPEWLKKAIVDTVHNKSGGLFLWADLMIQQLTNKRLPSEIQEALQKAPNGLNEMLKRTLERLSQTLDAEDIDQMNDLLCWVSCAKRPLTLAELETILKHTSPTGECDLDLEGSLRGRYALFFMLEQDDELSNPDMPAGGDSDPSTTEVKFSQGYIAEFFRDPHQGKFPSEEGSAIRVDVPAANAHTLITVLQLLANWNLDGEHAEVGGISQYAKRYWWQHLLNTNLSETSADDKSQIGHLLVRVCCDREVIERWARFVNRNFGSNSNIVLRSWLEDAELFKHLSEADRKWVESTSSKPASTVSGLYQLVAEKWLMQADGWSARGCFLVIYEHLQSLKGLPFSNKFPKIESPDLIVETAEWAEFEVNANWHSAVAEVLKSFPFLDEATIHCKQALGLDQKLWTARLCLGDIHQSRGDHQRAMNLFEENVNLMKRESMLYEGMRLNSTDDTHRRFHRLLNRSLKSSGDCLDSLGRSYEAYTKYREAWTTIPLQSGKEHWVPITKSLEYLDKQDRCQEFFQDMKTLRQLKTGGNPRDYMTRYTGSLHLTPGDIFFQGSRYAAFKTGELKYLVEFVKDVIQTYREWRPPRTPILEVFLADLYYFDLAKPQAAVEIWEQVSSRKVRKPDAFITAVKIKAEDRLAAHYLSQAMKTKGKAECHQHVRHLESLSITRSQFGGGETINVNAASLILGFWYRLNGQLDEWKAYAKPHIRQALQILSDDDPKNDDQGYGKLWKPLLYAADDITAVGVCRTACARKLFPIKNSNTAVQTGKSSSIAVKNQVQPTSNDKSAEKTDKDTTQQAKDASSAQETEVVEPWYHFGCDGHCSRRLPHRIGQTEAFWMCRYCYNVDFCDECIKLVRDNKLPVHICSPQHDWLRVQLTDRIIPFGKVFVGATDELMDLEDFKNELQKKWDL